MPVGQGAGAAVGGEVRRQPPAHGAVGAASIDGRVAEAALGRRVALGIVDNDVPGADVQAVIALGRITRRRPKIVEVPRPIQSVVLVVADGRDGAVLEAAPGGLVSPGEVAIGPVVVGQVPVGKHQGARVSVDQRRRGHTAAQVQVEAVADISGPNQNGVAALRPRTDAGPA